MSTSSKKQNLLLLVIIAVSAILLVIPTLFFANSSAVAEDANNLTVSVAPSSGVTLVYNGNNHSVVPTFWQGADKSSFDKYKVLYYSINSLGVATEVKDAEDNNVAPKEIGLYRADIVLTEDLVGFTVNGFGTEDDVVASYSYEIYAQNIYYKVTGTYDEIEDSVPASQWPVNILTDTLYVSQSKPLKKIAFQFMSRDISLGTIVIADSISKPSYVTVELKKKVADVFSSVSISGTNEVGQYQLEVKITDDDLANYGLFINDVITIEFEVVKKTLFAHLEAKNNVGERVTEFEYGDKHISDIVDEDIENEDKQYRVVFTDSNGVKVEIEPSNYSIDFIVGDIFSYQGSEGSSFRFLGENEVPSEVGDYICEVMFIGAIGAEYDIAPDDYIDIEFSIKPRQYEVRYNFDQSYGFSYKGTSQPVSVTFFSVATGNPIAAINSNFYSISYFKVADDGKLIHPTTGVENSPSDSAPSAVGRYIVRVRITSYLAIGYNITTSTVVDKEYQILNKISVRQSGTNNEYVTNGYTCFYNDGLKQLISPAFRINLQDVNADTDDYDVTYFDLINGGSSTDGYSLVGEYLVKIEYTAAGALLFNDKLAGSCSNGDTYYFKMRILPLAIDIKLNSFKYDDGTIKETTLSESNTLPYIGVGYNFSFKAIVGEEQVFNSSHFGLQYYHVIEGADSSFYHRLGGAPIEPGVYCVEVVFKTGVDADLAKYGFLPNDGFFVDFEIEGKKLSATDERFMPNQDLLSGNTIAKTYSSNVLLPTLSFEVGEGEAAIKKDLSLGLDYFVTYYTKAEAADKYEIYSDLPTNTISNPWYPVLPGTYKAVVTLLKPISESGYKIGDSFDIFYTIGTVDLVVTINLIDEDLVYNGNSKGVHVSFVDAFGHNVSFVKDDGTNNGDYSITYEKAGVVMDGMPINVGNYTARVKMLKNNITYGIKENNTYVRDYSISRLELNVYMPIQYFEAETKKLYYSLYDNNVGSPTELKPEVKFLRRYASLSKFKSATNYYTYDNATKAYTLLDILPESVPAAATEYYEEISFSASNYSLFYKQLKDIAYEDMPVGTYPTLPNNYQVICRNENAQNISFLNCVVDSSTDVETFYTIMSLKDPTFTNVNQLFKWTIDNGRDLIEELNPSTQDYIPKPVTKIELNYYNTADKLYRNVNLNTYFEGGAAQNQVRYYSANSGIKIDALAQAPSQAGTYLAELTISTAKVKQAVGFGILQDVDDEVTISYEFAIQDTETLEFTTVPPASLAYLAGNKKVYDVTCFAQGVMVPFESGNPFVIEYETSNGALLAEAPEAVGNYSVFIRFTESVPQYGIVENYREKLVDFEIFNLYQLKLFTAGSNATYYDAEGNKASIIDAKNSASSNSCGAVSDATSIVTRYYDGTEYRIEESFKRRDTLGNEVVVSFQPNNDYKIQYFKLNSAGNVIDEPIDFYPTTVGEYYVSLSFLINNPRYWFFDNTRSISSSDDTKFVLAKLTILPADIRIADTSVRDKVFDGTDDSVIRSYGSIKAEENKGTINSSDNLRINSGNIFAKFDTIDVANNVSGLVDNKTVSFYTIIGDNLTVKLSDSSITELSASQKALLMQRLFSGNNLDCYNVVGVNDALAKITKAELAVNADYQSREYEINYEAQEVYTYHMSDADLSKVYRDLVKKERPTFERLFALMQTNGIITLVDEGTPTYKHGETEIGTSIESCHQNISSSASLLKTLIDELNAAISDPLALLSATKLADEYNLLLRISSFTEEQWLISKKSELTALITTGELDRAPGQQAGRYTINNKDLAFIDIVSNNFSMRFVSQIYQINKIAINITIDTAQSKEYDGVAFENIYFVNQMNEWFFDNVTRPEEGDGKNIVLSVHMDRHLESGHFFSGSLGLTPLGSFANGGVGEYSISINTLQITDGYQNLNLDNDGYYTLNVTINKTYTIEKREIKVVGNVKDAVTTYVTYLNLNNLEFSYELPENKLVDGHRLSMQLVAEKVGGSSVPNVAYIYRVVPSNTIRISNAFGSPMMSNYEITYQPTEFNVYYNKVFIVIDDNNKFEKNYGDNDPRSFDVTLKTRGENQGNYQEFDLSQYANILLKGDLVRASGEDVASYSFDTSELKIYDYSTDVSDYFQIDKDATQSSKIFRINKRLLNVEVRDANYTYGDNIRISYSILTDLAPWDSESAVLSAFSFTPALDTFVEGENVVGLVIDSNNAALKNYDVQYDQEAHSGKVTIYYPQNHLVTQKMEDVAFTESYKYSVVRSESILFNGYYMIDGYEVNTELNGVIPTKNVEKRFVCAEATINLERAVLGVDANLNLIELKKGVDYTVEDNTIIVNFGPENYYDYVIIAYKIPWWMALVAVGIVVVIFTLIIVLIVSSVRRKKNKKIQQEIDSEDVTDDDFAKLEAGADEQAIPTQDDKKSNKKDKKKKKKNKKESTSFVPNKNAAASTTTSSSTTKNTSNEFDLTLDDDDSSLNSIVGDASETSASTSDEYTIVNMAASRTLNDDDDSDGKED